MYVYDRLQGAMIGIVALFMGFAIEAVVIVIVVSSANFWKVHIIALC